MLTLFALAGLWIPQPGSTLAAPETPQPLHCRIELAAGAQGKHCTAKVPAGRKVRACGDADRRAGHCDAAGKGKYVAWVVGTGSGSCQISPKKTKWDKVVYAHLKPSAGGASTCDLYVEVK